jgi:F-box-like
VNRIDVLPDEVLLAIFDFYVVASLCTKPEIEKWQSLVHVCRRWRRPVFALPRHLNLRLFCTPETPTTDILDVWPTLPLLIHGNTSSVSSLDNLVVIPGHNNCIHEVDLWEVADSQLEKSVGDDAGAIPGDDASAACSASAQPNAAGRSRFLLGWSRSISATALVGWHTVSGIVEIPFVYHSPRQSSPSYSSVWVYSTRGNGYLPLRVDQFQPPTTF